MTTAQFVMGVATYGAGVYICLVIMGIIDSSCDSDGAFYVAAFWPISLIVLIIIFLIEWLDYHPRIRGAISRTLDVLTLPLRPLSLGKRLSRLFNSRCKQQNGGAKWRS